MTDITDIKTIKDAKMIVEICERWNEYRPLTKLEFFREALGSDWEDLTHKKLRRIEDKAYRIVEKWDDSIQERLRKGENNE